MAEQHVSQDESQPDNQTAGEKSAETNNNPSTSLEKARDAAEGKTSNASGGVAPSTAQEHIPANSDAESTDLPSAR